MGSIVIRWAVLLVVFCTSLGSAAEWQVGMARVDVTPSKLLWLAGYGARKHPAEGTLHRLWAKALVIEDQHGQRAVIVTTDLIGDNFGREPVDAIGKRVYQRTGIERFRILLNFSHTHCGPVTRAGDGALVTYPLDDQQRADVNAYTQTLEDRLVRLIEQACGTMRPAKLAYGVGKATFAANRRGRYKPNGPVDHTVPVLRVTDEDDRLVATLFGYACHTATLGGSFYLFNGDYAGFAQIAFEASHPSAMAMFMMGCGGDINPAPRGTVELAEQHGKSLAAAVDQVLADDLLPVEGPLTVAFERVDVPFVDPPAKEELRKRRGEGNAYDQRLTDVLLKRLADRGSIETSYPCPVQVVRFGDDLSLIALSGETVVDYALRIRKEFGGQRVWIAGYSNEVFAYLPSERVLAEGGYEGGGAMKYFGFHGPFKPGAEDRVVDLVKKLMEH